MSMWASQGSRTQDQEGFIIPNTNEIYFTTTTNSEGQFELNMENFNFTDILDSTAIVVGQTLNSLDDINSKLSAVIVEITNSNIKGAVVRPNTGIVISGTSLDSFVRAGAGIEVKVKVLGQR